MHVKETGCEGVDWLQMAQDRIQLQASVNKKTNFRTP
jgi:hypothetical protein